MAADVDRMAWVQQELREEKLDALVCSLPSNVLLLTGYWPVTGMSVAVATRERTVVLVPGDEEDLARDSAFVDVHCFARGSMRDVRDATRALRGPFGTVMKDLGVERGRIGVAVAGTWQPAPYSAIHLYQDDLVRLISRDMPDAEIVHADAVLRRMRAVKTPREVEGIRLACRIAGEAFTRGFAHVRPGVRETEAAGAVRTLCSTEAADVPGAFRADGFAWCMSGPNGALAHRMYARSTHRCIAEGDLTLIHVNSYVNGYWTDLTRTYCMGEPDERQQRIYEAVFAARAAALSNIRPGVRAAEVDRAVRDVLEERGYGKDFLHPTGHGVGYLAIDHDAPPRLHRRSRDVLEFGMVCTVEPAVYREGYGGLRQCDIVAVSEDGCEVLSDFQNTPEELIVRGTSS